MRTEVRRAIVHYADPVTGAVRVRIPGLSGEKAVPVSPEGLTRTTAGWNTPNVGDRVMVAVEGDQEVYWVSGFPTGVSETEMAAAINAALVTASNDALATVIALS